MSHFSFASSVWVANRLVEKATSSGMVESVLHTAQQTSRQVSQPGGVRAGPTNKRTGE